MNDNADPPAAVNAVEPITCPFCDSTDNELFALFSQFLLGSQYYCRSCRSVFDVIRWTEERPGMGNADER